MTSFDGFYTNPKLQQFPSIVIFFPKQNKIVEN